MLAISFGSKKEAIGSITFHAPSAFTAHGGTIFSPVPVRYFSPFQRGIGKGNAMRLFVMGGKGL
jgi:hypothetical protein